jgi:DNA helicase-2/ATP-dependent DNA helicase PcrA
MARVVEALNPAQRVAVEHGGVDSGGRWRAGPLLIIAGAGTGKTNTLAHRVAHLALNGIAPERILLLTFSRRAAQEMIGRARRIVAAATAQSGAIDGARFAARLVWAGTFHAIASRLLRQYAAPLGLETAFTVIDRADAADLLDVARQDLALASDEKRFPRKDTCLAVYSHCVNTRRALEHVLTEEFPWCAGWHDELRRLFRRYVDMKARQQVLDFDDLLLYWHALMADAPLAREVGSRYDHVLVDEYQDTNALQAEILHALKPQGEGLCVVGDDAQAIYAFRAATVENILQFPQRFTPPAPIVTLEQNYRSVQPILDVANALIAEGARQHAKRLRAQRAGGARPRHVTVADDQAQAGYVIERVLDAREQGVPLRRQSVLFRSSHHSDVLEVELTRRGIPYVKYGGLKFLEAAHVKDLLALLRWGDNPKNRIAAFRVLKLMPGIGPAYAERAFTAFEAGQHRFTALAHYPAPAACRDDWAALCALLAGLAQSAWAGQVARARAWYEPHLARLYESAPTRSADLEQLERIATQFATRERFLTELTLDPPQATGDLSATPHLDEDYLVLSTVHSAKGQEWDRVYVLNVTEGTFPSEYAAGKAELLAEERRVLYVAMTRARHQLDLIAPLKFYVTQQPRMGDGHVYGARSRFLTAQVMACLDCAVWPERLADDAGADATRAPVRIDVAARLRDFWA